LTKAKIAINHENNVYNVEIKSKVFGHENNLSEGLTLFRTCCNFKAANLPLYTKNKSTH